MEWVFWSAIGLVAYSYAVYPVLMLLVGRRAKRCSPKPSADVKTPRVAVVLAAFNEERHIEARIRNVASLDYPADKVALYIGSDGSTDATSAIALRHASERVRVFAYEDRRGKASVLNDLLASVREDIVVFTDANTEFERGAFNALLPHFADPAVGAVSGELRLRDPARGDNQDASYWRMETAIKMGESSVGGLLGANGGIYAIRRELYRPLPADTIVDDFTVVMNVSSLGSRALFEPEALAFEDVPPGIDQEFRRRVRIGIGNYQAFFRHPEYWLRANWTRRFTYISHKVLRWFTPHLLILALAASATLAPQAPYGQLLVVQLLGYSALGAAMILRKFILLPKVVTIPLFVFALNVAFIVAFWRYVAGDFSGTWRRTQRA